MMMWFLILTTTVWFLDHGHSELLWNYNLFTAHHQFCQNNKWSAILLNSHKIWCHYVVSWSIQQVLHLFDSFDYWSQQQQLKRWFRGPSFRHAVLLKTRLSNHSDFRHCLATSLCISDKSILRSIQRWWSQSSLLY